MKHYHVLIIGLIAFSCDGIRGAKVNFSSSLAVVVTGVTKALKMTCTVNVTKETDLKILSIRITRGNEKVIAAISTFNPAKAYSDSDSISVSGTLEPISQDGNCYLHIAWTKPLQPQTGHYECSVNILNTNWEILTLKRTVVVEAKTPTSQDLMAFISELETKIDNSITKLTNETADLKIHLAKTEEDINQKTSARIQQLAPHYEEGETQCFFKDFVTTVGTYKESLVKVVFRNPYTKLPKVLLDVNTLDVANSANTRYYVAARNVSAFGFDLICGTWADSVVYRLFISWIALKA